MKENPDNEKSTLSRLRHVVGERQRERDRGRQREDGIKTGREFAKYKKKQYFEFAFDATTPCNCCLKANQVQRDGTSKLGYDSV